MTSTTVTTLRLGTRRSPLALAQSGLVATALRDVGYDVKLVEVVTEGDRSSDAIETLGGTGVFVTELRRRLGDGDIDVAVHSLKDLPTQPADGLVLAAIPQRADARDALVARDGLRLNELPGATVGTGSPRRTAQLRALELGLDVVALRGNVDSRLRQVADRRLDAVVVAAAGLARLDRLAAATEVLDPGTMLPAPGQGALALECRVDDPRLAAALAAAVEDSGTRAAVTAERVVLADLEAGCTAPVGALADVAMGDDGNDEIYLRAVVAALDTRSIRLSATGPLGDPEGVGHRLANDLLDAGVTDLIGENP